VRLDGKVAIVTGGASGKGCRQMKEKYVGVDIGSSNGKIYISEITRGKKLEMKEIHRFVTPRTMYQNHLCTNIYTLS